jgi:hypothetical protein
MTLKTPNREEAESMIETLREGIPSKKFASAYSTGGERFLENVQKRHLNNESSRGKIRFVSGQWGSGKTHFLRLMREKAFDAGFLVSSVELSNNATPFDKFEKVFYDIVRNVTTPEMYEGDDLDYAAPFGEVLRRALFQRKPDSQETIPDDQYQEKRGKLMGEEGIDIDFRRVVAKYWETFVPEGGDTESRATLLQWFSGEGTISTYRSPFGILKLINRENSQLMLSSLSRFARHIGYKGVLILFDESQDAYSTMRRSNLRQAHNNLLHLINTIEDIDGLILVYAATPDFYKDPKHGIQVYGALAQRIGEPVDGKPPRALDRLWNFDAVESSIDDYLDAACKIRQIYLTAYPDADTLPEGEFRDYISQLVEANPEFSAVRTWRVVTTGSVAVLDSYFEGEAPKPPEEQYEDIMDKLRER